jgi:hypothetical protein
VVRVTGAGCRPAFRRSAALADVVASPKQNGCMET